eukprot:3261963-Rhodomonas_salina.1
MKKRRGRKKEGCTDKSEFGVKQKGGWFACVGEHGHLEVRQFSEGSAVSENAARQNRASRGQVDVG